MAALWIAISCAHIIPSSSSGGSIAPMAASDARIWLPRLSAPLCSVHRVVLTWARRMSVKSLSVEPLIDDSGLTTCIALEGVFALIDRSVSYQPRVLARLPRCSNLAIACSGVWQRIGGCVATRSYPPAHARRWLFCVSPYLIVQYGVVVNRNL